MNTAIGKITSHATMKPVVKANTRIVSFFNSSHYWGGQLTQLATTHGIKRSLQINTESRWYALILMFLGCRTYT